VAVYAAVRIKSNGKPAEPVARTSGEAQRQLKQIMLKGDAEGDDKQASEKASTKGEKPAKPAAKKKKK